MKILLSAHALDVSIGKTPICHALDLNVAAGERWAILGRNGVGKSTLLNTLAGLRAADAGELRIGAVPLSPTFTASTLRTLAKMRGVLTQNQNDPFPATVVETALVGRHPHLGRWDWESATDRAIAQQALAAVDLADFAEREVHTLSGGERQRLAIAQLLTQQPQIFLLDEPLTHLDLAHQVATMELFNRTVGNNAALVAVLHDPGFAARYCGHALLLFGDGEWLSGNSKDIITAANLSRLYGYPLHEISVDGGRWFIPS